MRHGELLSEDMGAYRKALDLAERVRALCKVAEAVRAWERDEPEAAGYLHEAMAALDSLEPVREEET